MQIKLQIRTWMQCTPTHENPVTYEFKQNSLFFTSLKIDNDRTILASYRMVLINYPYQVELPVPAEKYKFHF